MIRITQSIAIDEAHIKEEFVRSSGPGGQNVNKVATAVQLRYDVTRAVLPEDVRDRLVKLAGNRMTEAGELIISARRYRTQDRNRQDAMDRLIALVRKAIEKPKPRRKTKPTRASKERRLEQKRQRGRTKRMRGQVGRDDE